MSTTTEATGWALPVSLIASIWLTLFKLLTVQGSLVNCLLGLAATVSAAITVTYGVTLAGIYCLEGLLGDAFVALLVTAFAFRLLWWLANDDDDWFNGQFMRLKDGLKKLRTWRPRIPSVVNPLPSPT